MIVHGVLSLDIGGLEKIVVSLAKQTRDSAVICIEKPGALAGELEAAGVSVKSLDKPPGRAKSFIDDAEAMLLRLKATVVHTHQVGAACYLAPAAKRLNLRVVHTEHGNPFTRATSWGQWLRIRARMRLTGRSIDTFAVVSPEIASAVTRWFTVPQAKVTVVPNGIAVTPPVLTRKEIRDSLGIPHEAFVIGTVGRLHEVKQQDILISAAGKLKDVTVLLVGEGPERARLEGLARRINANVLFAGHQPQPANFLQAMDVFTLTSRSEGFPVSLLEAWSVKLPVIVHAVGGLPAIVDHEVNGVLIRAEGSSPLESRLAWECELMRSDPVRARKLGNAGCEKLERHYTLEQMSNRYRQLYAEHGQ